MSIFSWIKKIRDAETNYQEAQYHLWYAQGGDPA